MKKNLPLCTALIIVSVMLIACKKEATTVPPAPQNYTIVISEKTWWGTLTNAGETVQYYSVHFNADNTLTWSQFSGDYQGRWTVDNKKLTLTFTSPAVVVTAEISDDNKLTGITTSTANKVNTAELIANPNIQLEGSVWMGSRVYNMSKPPQLLQLSFMAGNTVQIKVDNAQYGAASYAYTRPASGGCIRLKDLKYFGIIQSAGEMKGCELTYDRPWQAYKQ